MFRCCVTIPETTSNYIDRDVYSFTEYCVDTVVLLKQFGIIHLDIYVIMCFISRELNTFSRVNENLEESRENNYHLRTKQFQC